MALYSVLGNEIYFFAKKKSLSPIIAIFQHSNVRNVRASTVYTVYHCMLFLFFFCLFVCFFLLSIFIYFTVFRLSYWLLISNPVHNASGQYLFNLAKTLSLVPHKKKCQVKKPKYKKVGGQAAEDQKQIRTSSWLINHPGSVHTKFYSCH